MDVALIVADDVVLIVAEHETVFDPNSGFCSASTKLSGTGSQVGWCWSRRIDVVPCRRTVPRLLARDPVLAAQANAVQIANARRRTAAVQPYIDAARRAGARTLAEMADALIAPGVPATRGGHRWSPAQIRRVLQEPAR